MKQASSSIFILLSIVNLDCVELDTWFETPKFFPASVEPTLRGYAKLLVRSSDSIARGDSSSREESGGIVSNIRRYTRETECSSSGELSLKGIAASCERDDGTIIVLPDRGVVSIEKSAEDNLYVCELAFDSQVHRGEAEVVFVKQMIHLSDPDGHIPWVIANSLQGNRILTRADFDIESMQEVEDQTLWFGDEMGPFLLHTDTQGRLLQAPIPLPDYSKYGTELRSPHNPNYEEMAPLSVMNALRQHGRRYGSLKNPVVSPQHTLLRDGNNQIDHYARGESTPSGVAVASSEIFDISMLQEAGFSVVPWTINDVPRMGELIALGVNGIISDRPDRLYETLSKIDEDQDGLPDFLHEDGTINREKFDAQGHRGARDLRPENTLPSIEAALDNLVTTVEVDIVLSSDRTPMVTHDVHVWAQKCRMSDGRNYTKREQVLVKSLSSTEIQRKFICDKVFRGSSQRNNLELSPVSMEFVTQSELNHAYVIPTLEQLFSFVDAYVHFYREGNGRSHESSEIRWKNAARLRFNIEAKTDPRQHKQHLTHHPSEFASEIARRIFKHGLEERSNIQSFDFRVPIYVQTHFAEIRTAYLFGDFPIVGASQQGGGTNLQGVPGGTSPWLAGMSWPYRSTKPQYLPRVEAEGGFEGMAMSPDKRLLYPILQKPLADSDLREVLIHEFDTVQYRYTGRQWKLMLEDINSEVRDFQLLGEKHGVVLMNNQKGPETTELESSTFDQIVQVYIEQSGEQAQLRRFGRFDFSEIRDPFGLGSAWNSHDRLENNRNSLPFVSIGSIAIRNSGQILLSGENDSFRDGPYTENSRGAVIQFVSLGVELPFQP